MTAKMISDDKITTPTPDKAGVDETDWIPLDPETDRGEHGLVPLILHRLGHKVAGEQVTIAQLLAQSLLDRALEGHFGALEEILIRIDGDAKNKAPAAQSAKTLFEFDDVRARKILDAACEKRESPSGD